MADKFNARVTFSAALAAGVAGWNDSGNGRLPPGSLFIGCGQDVFFSGLQLLAEDTVPSAAVSCCIFPALTLYNFENHYLQFLVSLVKVVEVSLQIFHVCHADSFPVSPLAFSGPIVFTTSCTRIHRTFPPWPSAIRMFSRPNTFEDFKTCTDLDMAITTGTTSGRLP